MKTTILILLFLVSCKEQGQSNSVKAEPSSEIESSSFRSQDVLQLVEDGDYSTTCEDLGTHSHRAIMTVWQSEISVTERFYASADCSGQPFQTIYAGFNSDQDYISTNFTAVHEQFYMDNCGVVETAQTVIDLDSVNCDSLSWGDEANQFTGDKATGYLINNLFFTEV